MISNEDELLNLHKWQELDLHPKSLFHMLFSGFEVIDFPTPSLVILIRFDHSC
jgi:hypothetical protein